MLPTAGCLEHLNVHQKHAVAATQQQCCCNDAGNSVLGFNHTVKAIKRTEYVDSTSTIQHAGQTGPGSVGSTLTEKVLMCLNGAGDVLGVRDSIGAIQPHACCLQRISMDGCSDLRQIEVECACPVHHCLVDQASRIYISQALSDDSCCFTVTTQRYELR